MPQFILTTIMLKEWKFLYFMVRMPFMHISTDENNVKSLVQKEQFLILFCTNEFITLSAVIFFVKSKCSRSKTIEPSFLACLLVCFLFFDVRKVFSEVSNRTLEQVLFPVYNQTARVLLTFLQLFLFPLHLVIKRLQDEVEASSNEHLHESASL